MFKLLKNFNMNKPANMAITILVLLVVLSMISKNVSRYTLSPRPIVTDPADMANDLFNLPYKLDCVPGPQGTASYYTKDLTPGGVCGAQEFVRSQAEDYKIISGIGGSLLN